MTRKEFIDHIKHPETLGVEDARSLKDLTERFPYFTAAHILYAYVLFKENDLDYPSQLKKTAAYSANRKRLKLLFNSFRSLSQPGLEIALPENRAETKLPVEVDKMEATDVVMMETSYIPVPDNNKILTREELIEKFILEEPRISPPKSTFFSPSEKAIKSNIDDDTIVSETLAQIYYKQGNIIRARRIYEKLSLLFPEKSSYFADQIEKMKL